MRRRLAPALAALIGVLVASGIVGTGAAAAASPIRHVFVIVLENESASTTFAPGSPAPYLSNTLRAQGAYLPNYYGVGHESNDNYIAMISGQAPGIQNQADCQYFGDFIPGTIGSYGQIQGSGCVYPATVPTIGSQLTGAGLTWRDYNESMGADPSRESNLCGHPALGTMDGTQKPSATDQYAARHDPFVYFHSIIDDTTLCDTHVVNLDQLPSDLSSSSTTTNYTFITPDLCDDGHDSPCVNGQPGGLAQADAFLRSWVPKITGSPAFRQNGLLLISFDEAATSDASSCCGEIPGPGSPAPGVTGPGGGRVGAVLLSPCIAAGTVSNTPYNHYAMLGSVENMFGLSHLGYAALPGEAYFGSDIFNRACGAGAPVVRVRAPAIASRASTRAQIRLTWSATAGAGDTIVSYGVQDRDLSAPTPTWHSLASSTRASSLTFKASLGHTYSFRVQALDSAQQTGAWSRANTIVPSRARVPRGRFSVAWKLVRRRGAWQNRAIQTSKRGAKVTLRYAGGSLTLIGERSARGGVARITVDGHSRTVRLHAGRLNRRREIYTARLKPGVHRLKIVDIRGLLALEGFAIASRTG